MSYEVGKSYPVLAVHVGMGDFYGWIPLLCGFGRDEDFIMEASDVPGDKVHAHIDWRFVPEEWYEYLRGFYTATAWESVVTTDELSALVVGNTGSIKIKKLECVREIPALDFAAAVWIKDLQSKFCKARLTGKCPHRGTAVEAMIEVDGKLVCPAHGLRWNKSGSLSPYRKRA